MAGASTTIIDILSGPVLALDPWACPYGINFTPSTIPTDIPR